MVKRDVWKIEKDTVRRKSATVWYTERSENELQYVFKNTGVIVLILQKQFTKLIEENHSQKGYNE